MMKLKAMKVVGLFLVLFLGVAIGITANRSNLQKALKIQPQSPPKDKYVAFLSEVYDTIKENYWEKITDEQLANIYILGTEKLANQPQPNKPKTKVELQKILGKILKEINEEQKKKEFSTQLADMVLANLQPFGRSRLYSQREETDLKNRVENRNPEVNQYQVLDLNKDATAEQIKQAYTQKANELKKESSPDSDQKLKQIMTAYQTLSDNDSRKRYDESGVEPTLEYRLLGPEIFYLRLNKFSPSTVDELLKVTQKVDKGDVLNTLVLDLRGNVGGLIDGLPYFLGPFIGNDQYAYQFYHQGNKEDFKTKIGWLPSLVRYKRVAVLVDENTQSSAEVMAAVIKKYNVGILIGTKTRGWGTVEKTFELKQQIDPQEKYTAFLVHSLTLRDDGQPIEGRGVEPLVSIKDPNWEKQLYVYFHYPELTSAIKEILKTK